RREERAVEARGWPMLSVWGRVPSTRVQPTPTPTMPIPGSAASTAVMYLSGRMMLTGPTPARGPTVGETPLMVHPIWPGFLATSVFYAVVLAGLYWALVVPRRFVREVG